ncbi:hypothetical protein M2146_001069 [Lachnospiraceae bacterium PF1-22]
MDKAYIASPLSHFSKDGVAANMCACRKYVERYKVIGREKPVALHHLLPEILNRDRDDEYELYVHLEFTLIDSCKTICFCGDTLTSNMLSKVKYAYRKHMKILFADKNVAHEAKRNLPTLSYFLIHDKELAQNSLELGGFKNGNCQRVR